MSYIKRLVESCHIRFQYNRLLYSMLFLLLVTGFMFGFGSPAAMDESAAAIAKEYIGNYLQLLPDADLNHFAEFSRAFVFNALIMATVLLSGLHLFGIALIGAALFYKAFTVGFAAGFLLAYHSLPGMLVIFLSILPQNLLFMFVLLLAGGEAAGMSLLLWRKNSGFYSQRGQVFRQYLLFSATMLLCVIVSSLLQGYFSPFLLQFYHVVG